MNRTVKLLALIVLAALLFQAVPGLAASNPQFDLTGIWKNSVGDQLQLFQEKDQVNGVLINTGWAHRIEGRYVGAKNVKLVLIRRTRAGGCEMTMTLDITASSANSLALTSVAAETGCGLTVGQSFPDQFMRVL